MSYPAYPEYKDSGVEWLGEVPVHWKISRLKFFGELITGITPPSDDLSNYAEAGWPWIRPDDLNDQAKSVTASKFLTDQGWSYCRPVSSGSTLVCCIGSIGKLGYIEELACTNQQITAVQPSYDARYLFYLVYASKPELDLRATGNVLRILNAERLGNVPAVMPPTYESAHIAIFLDHETARIDALVEEQQRLIALLKEKRQAMISHAVKSFGEGPEGKLGHYIDLLPGYAFPSSGFDHDDGIKLLRGANVSVGTTRWDDVVYWPYKETQGLDEYWLKEGDLVIGMDRPWISGGARVARIRNSDLPALLLQRVARVRTRSGLDQDFLELALSSQEFRDSIEADMTGVSVPHVSPEQISSFRIALPKFDKQADIAQEARRELVKLAELLEEASINISLMQERRSALISAAVTGKIDVRGWQPPLELSERRETADEI